MRFLLGVYDLVPTQCARLPESFAANFAYEWPDARVNRHVPGQIIVRVETFTALIALEHFAAAVVATATAAAIIIGFASP